MNTFTSRQYSVVSSQEGRKKLTTDCRLPTTGFTLLEVLVSLAIVSITLVVLIHSQLLSMKNGTRSGYYTTAIFLGNEILTNTLTEENLIAGHEGDGFEDYPEFSWTREVEDTEIGGLKKVKLVILGTENTQIVLYTYWRKR